MSTTEPAQAARYGRAALERAITERTIVPHFQPIVDLLSSRILGYEVLSRFDEPFDDVAAVFRSAEAWHLTWELERACLMAALERVAALSSDVVAHTRFFLNVSPGTLEDPRFLQEFAHVALRRLHLNPEQFVLEVSEISAVTGYLRFQALMGELARFGFRIALDDFGAGHSGLLTLIAARPHYLKLDRAVVAQIHRHTYKQHLLSAISAFAARVGSRLIAEGVETVADLAMLVRHGVRCAQGFLLGKPQPEPASLRDSIRRRITQLTSRYHCTSMTAGEGPTGRAAQDRAGRGQPRGRSTRQQRVSCWGSEG